MKINKNKSANINILITQQNDFYSYFFFYSVADLFYACIFFLLISAVHLSSNYIRKHSKLKYMVPLGENMTEKKNTLKYEKKKNYTKNFFSVRNRFNFLISLEETFVTRLIIIIKCHIVLKFFYSFPTEFLRLPCSAFLKQFFLMRHLKFLQFNFFSVFFFNYFYCFFSIFFLSLE